MTIGDATTLAEQKRRAGRRLIIGFEGKAVTAGLRELVREVRPAGFCLFGRNVDNPAQVADLNRELSELMPGALLSVDQEGGRVQRVRGPATVWPPMRQVGAAGDLTSAVARALSRELRAMGFNFNFAPVADVDSNPDNPVIGDRAVSADPASEAAHVQAFVRASHAEGVLTSAKHFPGHGDTDMDSHLDLPRIGRPEHCLLYTSPSPRDATLSRMPSSA